MMRRASETISMPVPTLTFRTSPVLESPSPARMLPATEKREKASDVDPTVIGASVMSTQPESAFSVPCSTKVKRPGVTSAEESASSARLGAPDAATT